MSAVQRGLSPESSDQRRSRRKVQFCDRRNRLNKKNQFISKMIYVLWWTFHFKISGTLNIAFVINGSISKSSEKLLIMLLFYLPVLFHLWSKILYLFFYLSSNTLILFWVVLFICRRNTHLKPITFTSFITLFVCSSVSVVFESACLNVLHFFGWSFLNENMF